MRRILISVPKRHKSQEINPILFRLGPNAQQAQPIPVPFDRNPARTWSHVVYAPMTPSLSWRHYRPFVLQHLRLKRYLDGYFHNTLLISTPHLYRTVAGNMVRLFVYNPQQVAVPWAQLEQNLGEIFGKYQGPGTSGNLDGRVKTRFDIVDLPSPLLNADILSQYVGRQLKRMINPTSIFDRLVATIDQGGNPSGGDRRAIIGADGLQVIGLRLRIKGRPRGEEMAVRHDFSHGSCPKDDPCALIDYGKESVLLRSGLTGIKAWIHFQRPHREDETGIAQNISSADDDYSEINDTNKKIDLLALDRDYDPELIKSTISTPSRKPGLWNVEKTSDPQVAQLTELLRDLHTPDYPDNSRFIW